MNQGDLVPGKHTDQKIVGKQMEIKIFQLEMNQKRFIKFIEYHIGERDQTLNLTLS